MKRILSVCAVLLMTGTFAACSEQSGDPTSPTLPPEPTTATTMPSEYDPNADVVIAGDFRITDADDKEWVSDGDVVSAEAMLQVNEYDKSYPVLMITLTEEGAKKFEQATTEKIGQSLYVWVGEMLLSTPQVVAPITDGKAIVTFSENRTDDLAEIEKIAQAITA